MYKVIYRINDTIQADLIQTSNINNIIDHYAAVTIYAIYNATTAEINENNRKNRMIIKL